MVKAGKRFIGFIWGFTRSRSLLWGAGGCAGFLLIALATSSAWALAELRPDKIHVADGKKDQFYIQDGVFVGGDRAINDVVIKDIRHASNRNYERVVIDLAGNLNGEPAAIPRPPYYQVSVTPDEKRMVITVWGKPRLSFAPKKVVAAFKKSAVFQNVLLYPRMENDSWTFVFEMKSEKPVEVFELNNPVRVIVDVRTKK